MKTIIMKYKTHFMFGSHNIEVIEHAHSGCCHKRGITFHRWRFCNLCGGGKSLPHVKKTKRQKDKKTNIALTMHLDSPQYVARLNMIKHLNLKQTNFKTNNQENRQTDKKANNTWKATCIS